MRNTNIILSKTNRFAAAIVTGLLWTGSSALAGTGVATAGGTSGGGHAAAPAGNGGGAQAAPASKGNAGQAAGAAANTAPAASKAPATVRAEPAEVGQGGNIRGVKSALTGNNQNQNQHANQRNGFNYGYYGYIGDPWTGYGWYGNSYPEGANFEEPVYNENSTATPANNSTDNSTVQPQTVPPVAPGQIGNISPSPAAAAAQLTNAVDKSPAMVAANAAVHSAQTAYDTERTRVLSALKDKPDYQQAVARKNDATQHVDAVKTASNPASVPTPTVTNAASVKLDASAEVTKMEEQAVAADPQAIDAKTKLNAAVADRDALRAKLTAPR